MNLGLQDLALFTLTVLVLNATPGVDLIFTLTRTLQHGVRGLGVLDVFAAKRLKHLR